jgi:lipopolysaccharide transport system permease protein
MKGSGPDMLEHVPPVAVAATRKWRTVITPDADPWASKFHEIWAFRDLLSIWIRRDIIAVYKQTILGPAWFFLQPVLTSLTYFVIFGRIAKLSTAGMPPLLFYLGGIICWSYFSDCLMKSSSFLKDNSHIFSKVYFPRLIVPISIVVTGMIKFGIQFLLFLVVLMYFWLVKHQVSPNAWALFFPVGLLITSAIGMGTGMLITGLTNRYKDLIHLMGFIIQLMMFLSPVFYPLDGIQEPLFRTLVMANPMTGIIETFRYGFTGKGAATPGLLLYAAGVAALLMAAGSAMFFKTEKNFIDTI